MKIYNVGPDELNEGELSYLPQDTVWIVYSYTIGDYCGDGEAVLLTKEGKFYTIGLGHCSCYGPIDSSSDLRETTLEEYLASYADVTENYNCKIYNKIKELLTEGVKQDESK